MGLDNINGWELVALILIGLFIFGPERLPKVIGDGMRMLRKLRTMASNATGELSKELGTTVELDDLHPKRFVRKHLLSEVDEAQLRRPLDDFMADLNATKHQLNEPGRGQPAAPEPRKATGHSLDIDAT